MKASEFVSVLAKKFPSKKGSDRYEDIANSLGISSSTVRNWAKSDAPLEAYQIANALSKARDTAVADAQYHTIKPVVEFYPIDVATSRQGKKYELLPQPKDCNDSQAGLRKELAERNGLYIFYDSRGRALYAGKAKLQSLWKEMNLAYNRTRGEVQAITLVEHPTRKQLFKPAYEQARQPSPTNLQLHDLAFYFSAYWIADGMIDDLEALLVRGFANDLLNKKMEKFEHLRS